MTNTTAAKIKKPYEIWIKDTKRGPRFYTWSYGRTFPVARDKANADLLSGAAFLSTFDTAAWMRGESQS